MSEPVTALRRASDNAGIAEISEVGPQGMITLRGDLSVKQIVKAAVAAGGVTMPDIRHCNTQGDRGIAWMSPDEVLIMCPYDEVHARVADLREKLAKHHALTENVSDARAVFTVKGPNAREVIAKLAPVDLHPDVFIPGMFRRTRLAQVPAAFWMPEEQCFYIVCFRSVAVYVYDVLKIAAQPGSEVGHFPA
jgi:sarcosine oxidase subunit gamma